MKEGNYMPIVFINCSVFPFVQWIISGLKVYETRNRNTLKSLIGKTVYLCETGKKEKVIRCKAIIAAVVKVQSKRYYERFRSECCIESGSVYDYIPGKTKYLYLLTDIKPVKPFVPENGIRHGYTWMEYNGKKVIYNV